MTKIALRRLDSQQIAQTRFADPTAVVAWLGAVQSQDYAAAKWALGLRTQGATDDSVEQALSAGRILRTHVMRPTWHFVTPQDIGWLLALTAPRVRAGSASRWRQLELDDALFARSQAAFVRALEGGHQLTRPELAAVLVQAGIGLSSPSDPRLTHILMRAELDGVICSGARRGKQFTYALLNERAPKVKPLEREQALAELARRYFTSHGPATVADFVWWSGLTVADARTGLKLAESHLIQEEVDGERYWLAASAWVDGGAVPAALLLPNYDEYLVGYRDRRALFDDQHLHLLDARQSILAHHTIVNGGQVTGIWRRTFRSGTVVVSPTLFDGRPAREDLAVTEAARRYADFLGMGLALHAG